MQKKHRLRTKTFYVFLLSTLVIPYTRLLTLLSKTKLLPLASHLYYLFLKVHESRIMLPSFGLLLLLFVYSFFLYSSAIKKERVHKQKKKQSKRRQHYKIGRAHV